MCGNQKKNKSYNLIEQTLRLLLSSKQRNLITWGEFEHHLYERQHWRFACVTCVIYEFVKNEIYLCAQKYK
jgi:hypothetical protein